MQILNMSRSDPELANLIFLLLKNWKNAQFALLRGGRVKVYPI